MQIRNGDKFIEIESTDLFPLKLCEECEFLQIVAQAGLIDRGNHNGNAISIKCSNQEICEYATATRKKATRI